MLDVLGLIPKNENLFFHCKLRNLPEKNYKILTLRILDQLFRLDPKSIMIPTYTYSFTKNNYYNISQSKSEVGRFSEEIRLIVDPKLRSFDPIFSHMDLTKSKYLHHRPINQSFGKNSIFETWKAINGIVVNYNLENFISTQFHFAEYKYGVSYRKNRIFKGFILKGNKKIKVQYNFFCKDNLNKITFNRKKIEKDLAKEKILYKKKIKSIKLYYFYAGEFHDFILYKLKKDEKYLIS